MEKRRPVTEDDIYLTELLIAKSFGNLKHAVTRASSDALGSLGESVGGTVKRHPYATTGTAVGAGIVLFLLFRLMGGGGSSKKSRDAPREERSRSGRATDLFGMLMPVVMPYLAAYIEKYLGQMIGKEQK